MKATKERENRSVKRTGKSLKKRERPARILLILKFWVLFCSKYKNGQNLGEKILVKSKDGVRNFG